MKPAFLAAAALAVAAAAVIGATPLSAQSQPVCGDRSSLVAQLEKKYGESRQAVGLQGDRVMLEVFASADTGTWTILFTRPDGVACAMAAGEAWRIEPNRAPLGPPA